MFEGQKVQFNFSKRFPDSKAPTTPLTGTVVDIRTSPVKGRSTMKVRHNVGGQPIIKIFCDEWVCID